MGAELEVPARSGANPFIIGSSAAKLPLPFGSDNSGDAVAIANGDDVVGGEVIEVGDIADAADAADAECGSISIFALAAIVFRSHKSGNQTHTMLCGLIRNTLLDSTA